MLVFKWEATIGGSVRHAASEAEFGAICDWGAQRTRIAARSNNGDSELPRMLSAIEEEGPQDCPGNGGGGVRSDPRTTSADGPPIPTPDAFIVLRAKLQRYRAQAIDAARNSADMLASALCMARSRITCKLLGQRTRNANYEANPLSWAPNTNHLVDVKLAFEWSVHTMGSCHTAVVHARIREVNASRKVPAPANWEAAARCELALLEASQAAEKAAHPYCPARSAVVCTVLGKPKSSTPHELASLNGFKCTTADALCSRHRMLAAHIAAQMWLGCAEAKAWDDADRGHIDATCYTKVVVHDSIACEEGGKRRTTRMSSCDLREMSKARPAATSALIAAAQWYAELERAQPAISIPQGTRGFEPSPWCWLGSSDMCAGRVWILWTVHRYAHDPRDVNSPDRTKYFMSSVLMRKLLQLKCAPIPKELKDAPLDPQGPCFTLAPMHAGKRKWCIARPARNADMPRRAVWRRRQMPADSASGHDPPAGARHDGLMWQRSEQCIPAHALETDSDTDVGSECVVYPVCAAEGSMLGSGNDEEILDSAQQKLEDEIHLAYCKAVEMGDVGVSNRRAAQARAHRRATC